VYSQQFQVLNKSIVPWVSSEEGLCTVEVDHSFGAQVRQVSIAIMGSRPFCVAIAVVFLATSTSAEHLGNLKAPDAGNWTVGDCILAQVCEPRSQVGSIVLFKGLPYISFRPTSAENVASGLCIPLQSFITDNDIR